ncbi:hypothetical protein V3C99_013854 [Haemonchus contortus]
MENARNMTDGVIPGNNFLTPQDFASFGHPLPRKESLMFLYPRPRYSPFYIQSMFRTSFAGHRIRNMGGLAESMKSHEFYIYQMPTDYGQVPGGVAFYK